MQWKYEKGGQNIMDVTFSQGKRFDRFYIFPHPNDSIVCTDTIA